MDEMPKPVFTWEPETDGQVKIVPGRASVSEIAYEIARQAVRATEMENGRLGYLPTDEELASCTASVHFSGGNIYRSRGFGPECRVEGDSHIPIPFIGSLVNVDYFGGIPVKAAISVGDEGIFFAARPYDANHRASNHNHVLRTANIALEARLQ